jgi:hypothetical protein
MLIFLQSRPNRLALSLVQKSDPGISLYQLSKQGFSLEPAAFHQSMSKVIQNSADFLPHNLEPT